MPPSGTFSFEQALNGFIAKYHMDSKGMPDQGGNVHLGAQLGMQPVPAPVPPMVPLQAPPVASTHALPASAPPLLPLQPPPENADESAAIDEDQVSAGAGSAEQNKPTSLAAFEKAAFANLSKNKNAKAKAGAKAKAAGKAKAKAAGKAKAKAAGKAKAKAAGKAKAKAVGKTNASLDANGKAKDVAKPKVAGKNGWKPASGVFGCTRCRGNVAGCSTCWSPLFNGKRFSSRQEWQVYEDGKKRKGNNTK